MWVGDQRHASAALHPGKRTGIIVEEGGWAGPVRKSSPPPGFDPGLSSA